MSFAPDKYHTSHGMRKWTIKTLDPHNLQILKVAQYEKPWKQCKVCWTYTTRCCERCAAAGWVDKTRYCSQACQAKDWENHSMQCQDFIKYDMAIGRAMSAEAATFHRLKLRQFRRWMLALEVPKAWVVRQAYLSLPSAKRLNTCLYIHLTQAKKEPQSPLIARAFEFKQENWDDEPNRPPGTVGFSRILIDGDEWSKGWTTFDNNRLGALVTSEYYCPQWPWLFSQCAAMGDIGPWMSEVRLVLLTQTVYQFPDQRRVLSQFNAPKGILKWEIGEESFDQWMRIMYPVVGSIRSRFHSPCSYPSKLYGHLA